MNTAPPPFSLAALLIGLGLFAAGVVLLWRGYRGRRRGDAPHCRRCGYLLVGIASERCPECGAALGEGAVVRGQRVRRPGVAIAGAAVALLGSVFVLDSTIGVARGFDWYRLRPTGWVIDDLQSPSAATSSRAWRELQRRMQSGDLSAEHRRQLAEVALAEQATAATLGPRVGLIDWLGQAVAEGKLSEQQTNRFYQQAVRLELRVRPKVALGDPIPYLLAHQGRTPGGESGWWRQIEFLRTTLDGKQVERGGGSSAGSGFGGGSTGSSVPSDTPGRHTVGVVVRIRIFHGGPNVQPDHPDNRLMHEREVTLTGTTEVLAESPEDWVALIDDPALAPKVRASIKPTDFARGAEPGKLSGVLDVDNAPASLAFEVFARAAGKEYPLGSVSLKKGRSTNYHVATREFTAGPVSEIDLVLRSSQDVARGTVDLFEIWQGELTFPQVPVKAKP